MDTLETVLFKTKTVRVLVTLEFAVITDRSKLNL